jgi:hypothetical protein
MKLEFFRKIFEESSNINFIKIHPMAAEVFHADGHDEVKSRFSQFCQRA